MRDLCKRLGIQPKLSTAFHPQTDGQTEQMNRDLQQYLRLFTAEKQDEWVDWLPLAQFSYNTKKQASTQKSPFEVTRFYVPRMGFEQRITKAPAAEKFTSIMQNTLAITVHLVSHRVYLFSFLRRTHLLWGLYSYDWYHCMYLVGSTTFSLFLL
jgi:transposase InsO family protein